MKKEKKRKPKFDLSPYIPISPMYPFRDGAKHFALPGAPDIDRGRWDENDMAVIKRKAPEAICETETGKKRYSLKILKAILIKDCNVRPQDIPDLDRPTIISLLQQRTVESEASAPPNKQGPPVKLREFFDIYCEPLKKNRRDSRVKALQRLNQRGKLKPSLKRIGKHERGSSDKFLPSFLIENWSKYIDQLRDLPPLKSNS